MTMTTNLASTLLLLLTLQIGNVLTRNKDDDIKILRPQAPQKRNANHASILALSSREKSSELTDMLRRELLVLQKPPGIWVRELKPLESSGLKKRETEYQKPPGLWGREAEFQKLPGIWGKETEFQKPTGIWERDAELQRPPGRWGRESEFQKPPGVLGREAEFQKPPGFWGREIISSQNEKPPGFWGREIDELVKPVKILAKDAVGMLNPERWIREAEYQKPPGVWGREAEMRDNKKNRNHLILDRLRKNAEDLALKTRAAVERKLLKRLKHVNFDLVDKKVSSRNLKQGKKQSKEDAELWFS